MRDTISHYVNGREVNGASGRFADGYNPATGTAANRVPLASTDEVDAAIHAAHQAFPK